jgi:hypothetical protein
MGVDYSGGWNAVIATGFANVDRILSYAYQQNITPHKASGEFKVSVGPYKVDARADGEIGPWSMIGGSGQNVLITVPFTGGKAAFGTTGCELAGVSLIVQVLLRYVKSTVSGGGTTYKLMLTITDPHAIVSVAIKNPPSQFTPNDISALADTLRQLLVSATVGEGIAIANLDLSRIASNFPWLMPTRGLDYAAGSNSAAPSDGQLGILIASLDPPPGTPSTLMNGIIPAGCDAVLVVSNMVFSKVFLAPPFAASINVSPAQLSYRGVNPTTVTFNGETSASGGTITTATATANNDVVTIHLEGNASPMRGVGVNFTIDARYALVLGGTPDQPVLTFQRTWEQENHSTDIAWWVYVVSGLSGGTLIQQIVNNTAGNSLRGTMPVSFASSIAWPYSGTVAITKALLPTPLQLGGKVRP